MNMYSYTTLYVLYVCGIKDIPYTRSTPSGYVHVLGNMRVPHSVYALCVRVLYDHLHTLFMVCNFPHRMQTVSVLPRIHDTTRPTVYGSIIIHIYWAYYVHLSMHYARPYGSISPIKNVSSIHQAIAMICMYSGHDTYYVVGCAVCISFAVFFW